MTDTHPEIARYMEERYAALTPFEKVEMACSMYDFAREIVIASILNTDPTIDPKQMRKRVFRRFYERDFSLERMQELLNYIGEGPLSLKVAEVSSPKIPKDSDWALHTERLVLTPITLVHAVPLYKLFGDPLLHTYATYKIQPYSEHLERIKRWEGRISPSGDEIWLNWIAELKSSKEVIGHFQVGIKKREATIGYLVARSQQQKGYATEALKEIFRLLEKLFEVHEAKALIDIRNERSIQLVERLGMSRLGFIEKNNEFVYGIDLKKMRTREDSNL